MGKPFYWVKRLIFAGLILLLSVTTIAKEVQMWTWYGGVLGEIFRQIIKEDFTAKTGIDVVVRTVPEDDSHFQSFLLAYIGGNAPDIVEIYSHHAGELGLREALVDLRTLPDSEKVLGQIAPALLESVKFRGSVFAIPSEVNWEQMYYRKDILTAMGSEPPKTWDELGVINVKLRANGKNSYYEFQGDNQAANLFYPLVWQRGIDIYNQEGTESNLDDKEAIVAFIKFTSLYTKYGLLQETPIYTTFANGEVPIAILQNWHYSVIEGTAPQIIDKWSITEIPGTLQNNKIDHTGTGKLLVWGIPDSSKKKNEAWELLKFLSSNEFITKFMNRAFNSQEKWRLTFSNQEALVNAPFPARIQPVLDACLKHCKLKQVVPGGYSADRYIAFAYNKVVINGEDPEKAIRKAAAECTVEIQKKIKEFSRFIKKL